MTVTSYDVIPLSGSSVLDHSHMITEGTREAEFGTRGSDGGNPYTIQFSYMYIQREGVMILCVIIQLSCGVILCVFEGLY